MTLQEKINHAVYQYLTINTTEGKSDRDGTGHRSISRFYGATLIDNNREKNIKDHDDRISGYSESLSKVVLEVIKNHIE